MIEVGMKWMQGEFIKRSVFGGLGKSGNRVRGIVMTAMKVETPGEVDL